MSTTSTEMKKAPPGPPRKVSSRGTAPRQSKASDRGMTPDRSGGLDLGAVRGRSVAGARTATPEGAAPAEQSAPPGRSATQDQIGTDRHRTDHRKTHDRKTHDRKTDHREAHDRRTGGRETGGHETDDRKTGGRKSGGRKTDKPESDHRKTDERAPDRRKASRRGPVGRSGERARFRRESAAAGGGGAWAGGGRGGAGGGREWLTVPGGKRVLAIVHTLTYLKRLLEVLVLLEGDFRVQVLCTAPPHVFGSEVPLFLSRLGIPVVPWESARRMTFDLALAAGPGGVSEVSAPLVALSHGAGCLKRITGAGPDEYGGAGLRRRDVMPDARTLPAALVLPHEAELRELARGCPEALSVARVLGDPVYDRIVASLPYRSHYRRALGLAPGQRLVTVVSTWGRHSSFGRLGALLPRLTTELPGAGCRTALLVHPHVWSGHGAWQVRSWLAEARRRGVALVSPGDDWRPWLIASDHIIGDGGSVTVYGTLTEAPILLAGSPEEEFNPGSPAAALAMTAPSLDPVRPLAEQLSYASDGYRRKEYAAIAARLTSHPGDFGRGMRRLLYELLGIGRPAYEPVPVPLPPPLPPWGTPGVRGTPQ